MPAKPRLLAAIHNPDDPRRFSWRSTAAVAAFVAMVSVVVPLLVIVDGLKLQVASEGSPAQDAAPNVIAPGRPSRLSTFRLTFADVPGDATVTVVALADNVKSAVADDVDFR
jgi:hypothetical protein